MIRKSGYGFSEKIMLKNKVRDPKSECTSSFVRAMGLKRPRQPSISVRIPADLVVLSFSDSDLAAFAAGWRRGRTSLPSLRLANLVALRHPLSVDTYIERTLSQARGDIGAADRRRILLAIWNCGAASARETTRRHVGRAAGGWPRRLPGWMNFRTLPLSTLRRLKNALRHRRRDGKRRPRSPSSRWHPDFMRAPCWERRMSRTWVFYDPARGVLASLPHAGKSRALVAFYRFLSHRRRHGAGRCADFSAAAKGL